MNLAATRDLLRSSQLNVLVEAPAGCGKTFEAAELALDVGSTLPEGASVLVLAHTNAAVQEFIRRIKNSGARVRATTIDSFCVELLEPYANRLGLPSPLRRHVGLGAGRLPFDSLAPAAVSLLTRCPSIAIMLAARYPVVILDEHQDSSVSQHNVVASFRHHHRCRVRVFGDPMQAIYENEIKGKVAWDQLLAEAASWSSLTDAQRWRADRALGDWILLARSELRCGRSLPVRDVPPSVDIKRIPGLRCAGFGYGNAGQLTGPVQAFSRKATGSIAVLSRYNNHVWGLHIAAGGTLRLNEGSDYEKAYTLMDKAIANQNSPQHLARCLLAHIQSVSTGLDRGKYEAVETALAPDRVAFGRHKVLRGFLEKLEAIYANPGLAAFCEAARTIVEAPPDWLTIRMPASMRLVGHSRPGPGDNALECLDAIVARIKAGARRLSRTVSTVHKAKGLEYDHVLIGNFSASHFGEVALAESIC